MPARRRRGRPPSCHGSVRAARAKLYAPARPARSARVSERRRARGTARPRAGEVEDAGLARFLEQQGRLVRVGDGYAVSAAATSAPEPSVRGDRASGRSRLPASGTLGCRERPHNCSWSVSTARQRHFVDADQRMAVPPERDVAQLDSPEQGAFETADAERGVSPQLRKGGIRCSNCGRASFVVSRQGTSAYGSARSDLEPKYVRPVVMPGRIETLARLVEPLRIEIGVENALLVP